MDHADIHASQQSVIPGQLVLIKIIAQILEQEQEIVRIIHAVLEVVFLQQELKLIQPDVIELQMGQYADQLAVDHAVIHKHVQLLEVNPALLQYVPAVHVQEVALRARRVQG